MSRHSDRSLLGAIAFLAMCLCGIIYLIQGIIDAINFNGDFMNALGLIAKCLLYFVVAVVAYGYVSDKQTVWKVIYWVIVVVYIVTVILNIRFW